ncbi:amino acid transporter [Penicillium macrosclerotiorum]|uniref:amino acid transporter n=1 Tax=Penicillium macrosclerotiorum TaxID=303699 RepID=UPI002546A555|nr:amino acid transporter [Penicillium macrosclerotiorum]KAJ5683332.1 amino acid transporter [Penicillium macrosclerotiorum]
MAEKKNLSSNDPEAGTVEEFGYDPAYRRVFQGLATFSLVLATASPMTGIFIQSPYQIVYGGYWGLVWGWIIPAVFMIPQALAVAELCSSMPINGAFYWWTAALAPPSWSRPLSFISGWTNVFQLITSCAGLGYACATTLTSMGAALNPSWTPTNAETMAISMAIMLLYSLLIGIRMEQLSWILISAAAAVLITTVLFIIAFPVSTATQHIGFAKASDVFGNYTNYSLWNDNAATQFTFFAAAWVITGWAGPAFVAEETHNASIIAPQSILKTYAAQAIMGIIVCLICAFCIVDMDTLAHSAGYPIYDLILSRWGTQLGAAFILLIIIVTIIGGSSAILTAASQIAAFARDGGTPFATLFSRVNPRTNMPAPAILALLVGTLAILLFSLSTNAASIIYSLTVIASLTTYILPIVLRLFAGPRFVPGPWHYGRFSKPIHALAALCQIYFIVIESFPTTTPVPTAASFNYNWVLTVGVMGAAVGLWFLQGHAFADLSGQIARHHQQARGSHEEKE